MECQWVGTRYVGSVPTYLVGRDLGSGTLSSEQLLLQLGEGGVAVSCAINTKPMSVFERVEVNDGGVGGLDK